MMELNEQQKEQARVAKYYDSNIQQFERDRSEYLSKLNPPIGRSMRPVRHPSIQIIE
jgi:hypothetical protein